MSRLSRANVKARESIFASGPEQYIGDTLARCPPDLEECVLAMEDCCEEAYEAQVLLRAGTQDLPRMSKILENEPVFLLVNEATVKRYKSDLADEIEPVIAELIERAQQGLSALEKKEHSLQAKIAQMKPRNTAGAGPAYKHEARRLQNLIKQRERLEADVRAAEEEILRLLFNIRRADYSTVPKIVIKPRNPAAVAVASSSSRPSNAPTPTSEVLSAQEEDDVDQDVEEGQAMDVDQDLASQTEDNIQTGDEDMTGVNISTGRPRGRPRGRGRGALTGSSTPRGRGKRGRGRGRGRGSSLLIRLPKRGDDDADIDGDADIEGGDADADEGTPLEGDVEQLVVEKEVPMGGGKPFRKIHGQVYIIDGDEFVTEDNPIGDEKIDQFGNLLGGRRFKAATFILPNRHPQRQYMLAIDAARTSGFRDSLYYFRRNLLALKLNVTQPEKDHLIAEGKLGSHLRTRSVTLITARSAFKLHGSKMIIDGRWVVDDYYEDKVLEEITARGLKAGDLVGELPDPNAAHHNNELSALNATATAASNKIERGGGGGGVYRAGGPTTLFGGIGWGPYSDGPLNAVRKSILSRDGVGEENWMYMMATRVSDASAEWTKLRKEAVKVVEGVDGLVMGGALMPPADASAKPAVEEIEEPKDEVENEDDFQNQALVDGEKKPSAKKRKKFDRPAVGVYDPHSHTIHYRSDTQPTSARWEALPDSVTKRRVLGGTKTGNGAWALAWVDTIMELPGPDTVDPEAAVREQILRDVERSGDVVIDLT